MAKWQVGLASQGLTCVAILASLWGGGSVATTRLAQAAEELKSPSAFSGIGDRAARSRALFAEAAKVVTGPRCMNCHPAGDHPTQGDNEHVHEPAAFRGEAGVGVPGLPCISCHNDKNFPLAVGAASYQSIPGDPRWGLAPIEMSWQGKTPAEICRQIKIRPATAGGASHCCRSIWRRMTSSAGPGIRVQDAGPPQEPARVWGDRGGLDRIRCRVSVIGPRSDRPNGAGAARRLVLEPGHRAGVEPGSPTPGKVQCRQPPTSGQRATSAATGAPRARPSRPTFRRGSTGCRGAASMS